MRGLSEFLSARVGQGDVPCVVAAVANANDVLYTGAFGKRNVAADVNAAPDTIFRLASMTKPVTSLAAMMLVDDGRLVLDDPIPEFLPGYRQPPVLLASEPDGDFESRPASRDIRVRDLLANTSGIAYPFFNPVLSRLSESGVPDLELPLLHDPGARWTYGPSTALLARIIMNVSGQPIDDFCQQRIFEPLGMHDTAYAVPGEKTHRLVTQRKREIHGGFIERDNPPAIQSRGRGDDGLLSTAGDYLSFLRLFLNRGRRDSTRLLREQTIDRMMANQIGDAFVELLVAIQSSLAEPFPSGAGKDKFGFGFQIETEPSDPELRSPGSLSWAGIFNTYFWVDPRKDIAAVVMMQFLPGNDRKATDLFRGFERRIYASLKGPPAST
jgi:methyl acetate hydrolase